MGERVNGRQGENLKLRSENELRTTIPRRAGGFSAHAGHATRGYGVSNGVSLRQPEENLQLRIALSGDVSRSRCRILVGKETRGSGFGSKLTVAPGDSTRCFLGERGTANPAPRSRLRLGFHPMRGRNPNRDASSTSGPSAGGDNPYTDHTAPSRLPAFPPGRLYQRMDPDTGEATDRDPAERHPA
jgi:hypothetical protein